ncbi:hypothetical protein [Salegentibacter maritimus]|uniref:hypothetical protein n=1 Tax=Salegentibacter maritimus TaxID=2794347 RepID=UPI0018E45940|nr:hypothetical protein [Salegentibacter maritimus]MBI6116930.1 hypothetical protein [Salegentibacter maritimus]
MKNTENYGVSILKKEDSRNINGGKTGPWWPVAVLWSAWENFDDIKDGLSDGAAAYDNR